MAECGFPIMGPDINLSEVPAIHQKRTLAFLNHFLVKTVTFANNFSNVCESHFIDFERKIQKVEASLLILESKLSSIPGLDDSMTKPDIVETEKQLIHQIELPDIPKTETTLEGNTSPIPDTAELIESGVKASEDVRYKKFFRMLQFGVPIPAVKQKMLVDGLDSAILDNPNQILHDGSIEKEITSSDSDS